MRCGKEVCTSCRLYHGSISDTVRSRECTFRDLYCLANLVEIYKSL
jgi:hypothetical protein